MLSHSIIYSGVMNGTQSERLAAEFLVAQGLQIIERNVHCRGGEIDIIAQESTCILFIEVRFRSSQRFGSAAESINARKISKIIHCAEFWIAKNTPHPTYNFRFDSICMQRRNANTIDLEWIQNAF